MPVASKYQSIAQHSLVFVCGSDAWPDPMKKLVLGDLIFGWHAVNRKDRQSGLLIQKASFPEL